MRGIRDEPYKSMGLSAVSLALVALILGVGWVLISRQHPGHSSASPSSPVSPASACTGTILTPASNVQAAINNASPGTTFCFRRGIYQVSSLIPKTGDVLDGGHWGAVLAGDNTASCAIYGGSALNGPSDVTVRGFVVHNFKTPLQRGAIQDYNGPGWIIQDNHITQNAAAGVATGSNVRVLGNLIDHNGQEGFSAHGGGLYEDNEIAYNNDNLVVDAAWEAGGGKAYETRNLTFRSNYVHDNGGNGLWADTNNIYTTFDGNTITNNSGAGIFDEDSYNATIINNTITDNGMPSSPGGGNRQGWGWDAGIQIRASGGLSPSSPLLISHNRVTNNYNSIILIQSYPYPCSDKGEGRYGPCRTRNVIVEANNITMDQGATGEFQDGKDNSIFVSWNNRWLNNRYCVASAVHPADGYAEGWFASMNRYISWSGWQNYGLDKRSTFRVSAECGPS